LTFRRWQASQARFTEVGTGAAADDEDDGVDEDMIATRLRRRQDTITQLR
jgi:hypothetical protein